MAQPYIGEIRMFAGNFAPVGWMFCAGQLLPISENETLFTFIGTTYGGDGESTFALPDFRGRIPIHQGNGHPLAETAGMESVSLAVNQIPIHTHAQLANSQPANQNVPTAQVLAQATTVDAYVTGGPFVTLSPVSISPVGGSQPHTNFQPYLCLNYIISLFGLIPSPT
jgi:microcystin-dependent protein